MAEENEVAEEKEYVKSAGGNVRAIPVSELEKYEELGYEKPSESEIASFEQEEYKHKRFGGLTGEAKAFGLGLGSSLSLGLSDLALSKSGLMTPEELKGYEEENPIASGLGTATGVIAPAVLTGGSSLLAKGAASTAPSLITKAGIAAEKAAAKLLPEAETLLGKVAVKAATSGARGAAEGALYGIGETIHEQALGDPRDVAEALISEVGWGALLGGGFSVVGGASEVLIPKAIEKAQAGFSKVGKILEDTGIKVVSKVSGAEEATVREMIGAASERLQDAGERMKVAGNLKNALNELKTETESAQTKFYKEIRPKEAQQFLAEVAPQKVRTVVDGEISKLESAVGRLSKKGELYDKGMVAELENIVEEYKNFATPDKSSLQLFDRLNDTKGLLYEMSRAKNTLTEKRTAAQMRDLWADLKGSLTNEENFGQAGVRLGLINDAKHEMENFKKDLGKALGLPTTKVFGSKDFRFDAKKINTYLGQINDERGAQVTELLNGFVEKNQNLINQITESYKNAPVKNFAPDALQDLAGKTKAIADETRKKAEATMLLAPKPGIHSFASLPLEGAGKSDLARSAMEAAGLHGLLGPAGSAIAGAHAVYTLAKDAPKAAMTIASLHEMAQKVSQRIEIGTNILVKGSQKATQLFAGRTGAVLGSEFSNDYASQEKRYTKRVEGIRELANNPEMLMNTLSKNTEKWNNDAPNVAQAFGISSARAANFLASKIPTPPKSAPLAAKWHPSETEMSKFNRYYEAVNKPESILAQASSGTLTKEAVEAVKSVYPQLYSKIQMSLAEKMASHGDKMPYHSRLMVSLILGQDIDGTMSQHAIMANQMIYQGPSNKAPENQAGVKPTVSGLSNLSLSNRLLTGSQAADQRRNQ